VLGSSFAAEPGGVRLTQVFDRSGAQAAGLSPGDLVIAVDGLRVQADTFAEDIARRPVGEPVQLHAFRRDELRVFKVHPKPAPDDTCYLWWLPETSTVATAVSLRQAWLGQTTVGD
jgi:predicted metalloprotease with PDZ domain